MSHKTEVDRWLLDPFMAGNLAVFLNQESAHAKFDVMHVLELCKHLEKQRRVGRELKAFPPSKPTEKASRSSEIDEEINRTLFALNTFLQKFQLMPWMLWNDEFSIAWRPVASEEVQETPWMPIATAVMTVLNMTASGDLGRLRKCVCGKWFYAHRNKKLVCSDSCRLRKFKENNSEEFNKSRAEYMREYRDNPKVKVRHGKKNKTRKR